MKKSDNTIHHLIAKSDETLLAGMSSAALREVRRLKLFPICHGAVNSFIVLLFAAR